MSNLPLGFGLLCVGGLAVAVGFSKDHSFRSVLNGQFVLGDGGVNTEADVANAGRTASDRQPASTAASTQAGNKSLRDSTGAPLSSSRGGFVADPGTNFSVGQEPTIASRLSALGRKLGVTIHGISGYRTPQHSVAVGGFANDPHTQGAAADIGVNGSLLSSAASLSDSTLRQFGLYRPFHTAAEINHVALLPGY